MVEFTGHPKPLAPQAEAMDLEHKILSRSDEILERALRFANCLRASGHPAEAVHDLAQLLGAVARNDRKPTEVTEL
jgi:hypothetical protein